MPPLPADLADLLDVDADTLALLLAELDGADLAWLDRVLLAPGVYLPPDPLAHQVPPPGVWDIWLMLGGRGSGKTFTAADWFSKHMIGPPCDPALPGGHRGAIVAPSLGDGLDACLYGPSGLKRFVPTLGVTFGTRGVIATWPNGAEARLFGTYSRSDVDRLRAGGNRCVGWCEELAAWPWLDEGWDNLRFGLRIGDRPQIVASTTPKPRPFLKALLKRARAGDGVVRTSATTDDNPHLSDHVRSELLDRYAGTRVGRQELFGEMLDDLGDVFHRSWWQIVRETPADTTPGWRRCRYWDLAGTEAVEDVVLAARDRSDDPDWTVGTLVAWHRDKRILVVEDVSRIRRNPGAVQDHVVTTARNDGTAVTVVIERDPGQAGKAQAADYRRLLAGIAPCHENPPVGDKPTRADLVAGLAEQHRVLVVPGDWVAAWLDEFDEFTRDGKHRHDDQVDSLSGGAGWLVNGPRRRGFTGN